MKAKVLKKFQHAPDHVHTVARNVGDEIHLTEPEYLSLRSAGFVAAIEEKAVKAVPENKALKPPSNKGAAE